MMYLKQMTTCDQIHKHLEHWLQNALKKEEEGKIYNLLMDSLEQKIENISGGCFPDLSEEGHSDVSKNNFVLFIANTSKREGRGKKSTNP